MKIHDLEFAVITHDFLGWNVRNGSSDWAWSINDRQAAYLVAASRRAFAAARTAQGLLELEKRYCVHRINLLQRQLAHV